MARGYCYSYQIMENVKKGGADEISEKHQVTIPIDAMRIAGLEAGERVVARELMAPTGGYSNVKRTS